MSSGADDIRKALDEILDMYNIKLENEQKNKDVTGDYSEIIQQTQDKLDDLNEQAEAIFKKTGMTREQLESYANNPNNFTKDQWAALQKVRDACEKYKKESFARAGLEIEESKKKAKAAQKQTKKFGKKKNWIPL